MSRIVKRAFDKAKGFVTSNKKKIVATGVVSGTALNAAPLAVDTTAIMTDVSTAGAAGLTIALGVAAVAIAVGLVKKLIRA